MARACHNCVADENLCKNCTRNPANKQHYDYYQPYKPTCKFGNMYCINDPAYIYHYHREWYHKLYGNKMPEKLSDECEYCQYGEHYDDEDK